jgi:hypothetical protein
MEKLQFIFIVIIIGYSLLWFATYRFMKGERPVPMRSHAKPIETTTAEEGARGESSFETARGHQFGVTRAGFFILVILGYITIAVAFVLVGQHPAPHFVGGFSPKDFKEIQKVIRNTMWQGAFPDFSRRTLAATPRSLWGLATSRIEQVDVFPGGRSCNVHVRTPQGIHLFDMQAVFQSGQTNWQISRHGVVGEALLKRLGSTGFARFQVKGGAGLRGGKLPTVFYTPAVYRDQFESEVLLHNPPAPDPSRFGQDLNPISVSYEPHRVFPWGDSKPTAPRHDVIVSEGQFSGSLSNRAKLELRP